MDLNLGEMMGYGHYKQIFILYFNTLKAEKECKAVWKHTPKLAGKRRVRLLPGCENAFTSYQVQ